MGDREASGDVVDNVLRWDDRAWKDGHETCVLSLRMDTDVFERVERRIRQRGGRRAELITQYVDEGVRMDEHPGVVFRPGPAGRRPALVAGPDVWEVIRVIRNAEATGDEAIDAAARWIGLRRDQVETAVRYYSDYPAEIDEWLRRLDEEVRPLPCGAAE